MADRRDIQQRLIVGGRPYVITLLHNPTIDDVLLTEARVAAAAIESKVSDEDRSVSRDIRDYLIRTGVER
jgi:hypothetical protein